MGIINADELIPELEEKEIDTMEGTIKLLRNHAMTRTPKIYKFNSTGDIELLTKTLVPIVPDIYNIYEYDEYYTCDWEINNTPYYRSKSVNLGYLMDFTMSNYDTVVQIAYINEKIQELNYDHISDGHYFV